jgi:glutamine amidotransferase-like uncharacterized protein
MFAMEKQRRIIVYDDPRAMTAASGLTARLKESFPGYKVDSLPTAAFLRALDNDGGAIAVIPGISGDDCRYTDLMGGEAGHKKLRGYVERGGILLTVCAGSYFITRKTEWTPHWGPAKERTNHSALFNAVARGPVGAGRQAAAPGTYNDCTVTAVEYRGADGRWRDADIAYGNGPALYPDDTQEMDVLARYRDVPGNPIAAAWLKQGKGAVLWLGVLPYLGYDDTPMEPGPFTAKYRGLMEKLRAGESGRRDFWAALVGRMTDHLSANRRWPSPPPQQYGL